MFKKITLLGVMLLSIPWLAAQNIGIGTSTPGAKLDVRGNKISYDVLNVSNDKDGTPDSLMVFSSDGNLGIGVPVPGPYKLVTHGLFPTAFSPQVEFWNGDPNLSPSMMLADINDAGGSNGMLNLYSLGSQNATIRALGNSYLNGGNLGIGIGMGTTPPNEILHLGGAIVLGQTTAATPVAGTIHWSGPGGNFVGYNGSSWLVLDMQQDGDWMLQPGGSAGSVPPGHPELVPMIPSSVALSAVGAPNPGAWMWISDHPFPTPPNVTFQQHLMIESTSNLLTHASMLFRMSDWSAQPPLTIDEYSQGIFAGDLSYKIYRGPVLGPTFQSDLTTMFRANPSGIIDLPNQSRVRAFQEDADGSFQLILPLLWTPVNFTIDQPLPNGYDEQSEFTVAPSINAAVPPEQAYFTAAEEGYYQVNARCEFNVDEYYEDDLMEWMPVQVNPDSYVSIAIYTGMAPGQTSIYAQGNNLQIGYVNHYQMTQPQQLPEPPYWEFLIMDVEEIIKLRNNNAPNVSDVVYLQAGEIISIWVYHTAITPMNLNYIDQATGVYTGKSKIYVSIHKAS